MQALDSVFLLKSKERFKSHTHDVHFLGHFCLYNIWGFIHWQLCLGRCILDTKKLSNYAVDLDFIGFVLTAFKLWARCLSSTFWLLYGWSEDKSSPWKQLFFYSFAGLKCTVTIETTLPQYGICKENSLPFWCNSFFPLFKCSRKNQTRVWLKCYLLHKMHFKISWFVLLKNKFMLSRIHINGGSSIAGLGNMWGGGFVFLKHYHRQCICWLDYVASYPLTILQFQRFCFPC